MTRNGKIARLPRAIRDELNRRLADGGIGSRLVTWLNSLPEVQQVLKTGFGARPINEQNLSEWRQGGFEDWLRHEDARAWVSQLAEESDDLEKESGSIPLADRVTYPAMLALSGLIRQVLISSDAAEQRRTVISAAQQLTQLRRVSHQAEKLRLEKERWELQEEEAREKIRRQAEWLRLEQERVGSLKAEIRQEAIFRARYVPDLHPDNLSKIGLDQAQSNQIKPQKDSPGRTQTCPSAAARTPLSNLTSRKSTRQRRERKARKPASRPPACPAEGPSQMARSVKPGAEHRAPNTEHRTPSTEHRAPGTGHQELSTPHFHLASL